jgi:hypothetical protein
MPYEFALGPPQPVLVGAVEYSVDFDLGVDTDSGEQVLMTVAMIEDDGGSDPFELVFGIRRTNIETGITSEPAFDHETARKYVPKDQSEAVMLLILASVRLLVESVNPTSIVVETYEADLPPEAMGKYFRICNHLGVLQYKQTSYRRDATDLKDYWLFEK